MSRKKIGVAVLLISIGFLIFFSFQDKKMKDMTIELAQLEDIMRSHKETSEPLIQSLKLNGYDTVYDELDDVWYYSLMENHKSAINPIVEYQAIANNVQVVFFDSDITDTKIEQNISIKMIAYDDVDYHIYEIVCTKLPLLSIRYDEKKQIVQEKDTKIEMTLLDNRKDATSRITSSSGKIHVRGATSTSYPKKGYKFTLIEESMGNNLRKNRVSLLGMRQNEEWILYAGYNDQEKVRNVFSMNLWMDSCSKNNSFGIINGVEYRYVELFMNGKYHGLYALGYQLDQTQMQLSQDINTGKNNEYIFKKVNWSPEGNLSSQTNLKSYELRGKDSKNKVAWKELEEFFKSLESSENIEELYNLTDIQNSIDIYLFYNLVQGMDNIGEDGQNLKNTFLTIKKKEGKSIVLYAPWDLDVTFGNMWMENVANNTKAYSVSYRQNYIMQQNVIKYLHQLKDPKINQMIVKRYQNLRENEWSNQKIEIKINEYENWIYGSGAYRRDRNRWPNGSYMNPDTKLSEFKNYVLKRLQYMDAFIQELNNNR